MAKRICLNGHVIRDDKALKCSVCGLDLPPVSKKKFPCILVLFLFTMALVVIGLIIVPPSSGGKVSTSTPLPISNLNFFEIRDQNVKLTKAQWEAYIKPLIGQRIRWTGYVTEVEDKGSKGYLWLDMDPPDTFSVQDLYIDIPKEDILKYNKDQKITFEGDLERIGSLIGIMQITFKNAVIVATE